MTSLAFHVTIDCGMCCGGKDITGGNAGALRQPVTELHVYRAGPGVAAVQLKADGCFLPVWQFLAAPSPVHYADYDTVPRHRRNAAALTEGINPPSATLEAGRNLTEVAAS